MDVEVKKTIASIKSLEVQGARNVATAAITAIMKAATKSNLTSPSRFKREIENVAEELSESRPTEPMLRNLIGQVVKNLDDAYEDGGSVKVMKKEVADRCKHLLKAMESDAKKLAAHGAKLIPDNALVLTHCHSSTTTRILIEAKRMKKKFSVVAFETRPRWQGRTTAAELAHACVDVTLAVDGAMNLFMKKADLVLVGADSVTSRGDLINKIGTSTLAHLAKMNDVSFYSAAELSKYSPMTISGARERIEERDPKEVWETPPKGVKIRNPAFEATAASYISGYITELGVIPTQSFFALATQKLGIKIYEK